MGYRTYHTLTVIPDIHGNHAENIGVLSKYGNDVWDDEVKWYDCEADMREYSKKYPDLLFIIDGRGEESDDVWRHWYRNGAVQSWRLDYSVPADPPKAWP